MVPLQSMCWFKKKDVTHAYLDNIPDEVASICEMFDGAYRSTIACAELKPE